MADNRHADESMQIKIIASEGNMWGAVWDRLVRKAPGREERVSEQNLDSQELPFGDLSAEGEAPAKSLRQKRMLSVRNS